MAKVIVHTDEAPKSPAGYSQAVKSGGFVFVAGQGPFDARTGEVVGTTIQEKTARCLKNIAAILQAANSSLESVVSATFILGEKRDFAGMDEEWGKWFPRDPPTRQGAKLPDRKGGQTRPVRDRTLKTTPRSGVWLILSHVQKAQEEKERRKF